MEGFCYLHIFTRHDIAEIQLKLALSTHQSISQCICLPILVTKTRFPYQMTFVSFKNSNTTGASSEAGPTYHSRAPESTPGFFLWCSFCSTSRLKKCFVDHCMPFSHELHGLFFPDLWFLITLWYFHTFLDLMSGSFVIVWYSHCCICYFVQMHK